MSKQALAIIGNGFDLNCGLQSSYKDFFYNQISNNQDYKILFEFLKKNDFKSFTESKVQEIKSFLSLNDNITFFDIYFLINDWSKDFLLTDQIWSAIEDVLLSGVNISSDVISYEMCYNTYSVLGKREYDLYYSGLFSESILAYYLKAVFGDIIIGEEQYHNYLIKELNRFSKHFAEFIYNQSIDNDKYIEKAQTLLARITGIGFNDCKIISFNYTDPFGSPLSANIHGLASKNEIVFGITCGQGKDKEKSHNDWTYKMTKEYKMALIMSKGQKVSLDYNDIKDIYVYGLSLGDQDYDFFENLFDKFEFLMQQYSAKIHFCYSIYGNKTIEEVAEDITQKVTKLINKFGDSHKTYGLLRSMIQNGSLDIRLIK